MHSLPVPPNVQQLVHDGWIRPLVQSMNLRFEALPLGLCRGMVDVYFRIVRSVNQSEADDGLGNE